MTLKEKFLKIETQAEYDIRKEEFLDLQKDDEVIAHLKTIHGKGYVCGNPKGFIGELYKTPPTNKSKRLIGK